MEVFDYITTDSSKQADGIEGFKQEVAEKLVKLINKYKEMIAQGLELKSCLNTSPSGQELYDIIQKHSPEGAFGGGIKSELKTVFVDMNPYVLATIFEITTDRSMGDGSTGNKITQPMLKKINACETHAEMIVLLEHDPAFAKMKEDFNRLSVLVSNNFRPTPQEIAEGIKQGKTIGEIFAQAQQTENSSQTQEVSDDLDKIEVPTKNDGEDFSM